MASRWAFEHAVVCRAPKEFAWRFWTDVSQWVLDADIEGVTLDGPFAAGARGVTRSRSSGVIAWRIAEVDPGTSAVLEFPAPGATGRFAWRFEAEGSGTRMIQLVTFAGEQAEAFATAVGPALAASLAAGMEKLCRAIEEAAAKK